MKDLKHFNIPFVGLKEGNHLFDYQIDNTFFEAFQYQEYNNTQVKATVDFNKKNSLMELDFNVKGTVNIPCDLTGELFDQEIEGNLQLIIKFGPEFNDENEEILILPYEEYQINISQYIYELIILSMPSKRIHPGVKDGTLNSEALKKLKELEPKIEKPVVEEATDPRWDKLKNLLTDK